MTHLKNCDCGCNGNYFIHKETPEEKAIRFGHEYGMKPNRLQDAIRKTGMNPNLAADYGELERKVMAGIKYFNPGKLGGDIDKGYLTFYTAWLYDEDSTYPHCTHKYLGVLNAIGLVEVLLLIKMFRPDVAPHYTFDRLEKWHTNKGLIDVLVPTDEPTTYYPDVLENWQTLRDKLVSFQQETWPFRPHLTIRNTPGDKWVKEPFKYYALCSGRTVIAAWPVTNEKA